MKESVFLDVASKYSHEDIQTILQASTATGS